MSMLHDTVLNIVLMFYLIKETLYVDLPIKKII